MMKVFSIPKPVESAELRTEKLPVIDNGYFDVLIAIGYAALADSFYDGPSPRIEKTPVGFEVTHATSVKARPNLGWLKYSLAASWTKEEDFKDGDLIKKDKAWDGAEVLPHYGTVVDTRDDPQVFVETGARIIKVKEPYRELYGVINKLGSPKWFNACVYTCREKGLELLRNEFDGKLSVNSIVLPQSSKGAMSSGSFSIANGSLPGKLVGTWSRETCLAVAGLVAGARGSIKKGFALPVPRSISYSFLQHLVSRNRKRIVPNDFFFPYNNYLYYLKLLAAYGTSGKEMLAAVSGAKFIELGTQSSPAGVWSLSVPPYAYSFSSVDDLYSLLLNWRSAVKPRKTSEPNINRLAVNRLMRGFEQGDIAAFVEGYLSYLETVGLKESRIPHFLTTNQFFEVMRSNTSKYQELVAELRGPILEPIIELIRQDTYDKVFKAREGKSDPPDYQMIRKLREVQNHEDLVTAICEIAIKRSIDKMASENTQSNERKYHNLPTQEGIAKIIELSESGRYTPKLVANLLLALALSKTRYDTGTNTGHPEEDAAEDDSDQE
jgi:hypothetical protein